MPLYSWELALTGKKYLQYNMVYDGYSIEERAGPSRLDICWTALSDAAKASEKEAVLETIANDHDLKSHVVAFVSVILYHSIYH